MKGTGHVDTLAQGLPLGFKVRLRTDIVLADFGRVLIGGSPTRAVRLSKRAVNLVQDQSVEVTDPDSATVARRLLEGNLANPDLDGAHLPPMQLTVVVPVRDRIIQLDRCLRSLGAVPVVVVDDASTDQIGVAAVAARHEAAVVRLDKNLGPAGARNEGLRRVTTPLVAFVDSDVVVDNGALEALARHFADPLVAFVGPRIRAEVRRRSRPRWFERYEMVASSLDLGTRSGQVRPGAEVSWLPSACLLGRHSAVVHLGGFADELRVAEDVDLVWRAHEAGYVVRYEPGVVAHHDTRNSIATWLGRKFVYGTGGALLGARHGAKVAPARLSIETAIGAAALLLARWWSVPVAVATTVATTNSLRRSLPVEVDRTRHAVRLSLRGLGWGVKQESALLLRHWSPIALLCGFRFPALRRALVMAAVVDSFVFIRERGSWTSLLSLLLARRLDDLAYGTGLMSSALARRDRHCVSPRRPRG